MGLCRTGAFFNLFAIAGTTIESKFGQIPRFSMEKIRDAVRDAITSSRHFTLALLHLA